MLRNCRRLLVIKNGVPSCLLKKSFLTNNYKCTEAWNLVNSSPVLTKININDFYNKLDQNHSSKGVISAIDVDIFANAIKDQSHLEELKDLLLKLRLSAETSQMLDSTHHATIRNFIEFGNIGDLVEILKDPLNFGVFLDDYTANILLDKLITIPNNELAARVASLIMLQEDFSNEITCALSQYACYKYIFSYIPPEPVPPEDNKNKKVEEIKIRIKYLRNPYFDDHFDIKETITLSGKTLAWISEKSTDNLSINLQIVGWLTYKKYDKLSKVCQELSKMRSFKLYPEVLEILEKENTSIEVESKPVIDNCISILSKTEKSEVPLEKSLENAIENAINRSQSKDIAEQEKLFKSWARLREEKLESQTKRLDRAYRIQLIQEKQKELQVEEQKLWFFETEDKIDLQIEEKEKLVDKPTTKKKMADTDENYIPPEILPKRR